MATAKVTNAGFASHLAKMGYEVMLANVPSNGRAPEFRVQMKQTSRKARSEFSKLYWQYWKRSAPYWCEIDMTYKDYVIPR